MGEDENTVKRGKEVRSVWTGSMMGTVRCNSHIVLKAAHDASHRGKCTMQNG